MKQMRARAKRLRDAMRRSDALAGGAFPAIGYVALVAGLSAALQGRRARASVARASVQADRRRGDRPALALRLPAVAHFARGFAQARVERARIEARRPCSPLMMKSGRRGVAHVDRHGAVLFEEPRDLGAVHGAAHARHVDAALARELIDALRR